MANIFQKPSAALALIATAVAGPYAAFETDVGVFARRIVSDVMGESTESGGGDTSLESTGSYANYPGLPHSGMGPVPVNVGSMDAPSLAYQNVPASNGAPAGYMVSANMPGVPAGYPGSAGAGPLVNAVPYGEQYGMFASSPVAPQILESNRGPTSMVPGGTQQLWDYTLGVPTLEQLGAQPQQLGGGMVHDLREVLRFDIHPNWLPQRFSRVTTVLSNVQYDGLRVPLITGTRPSDLAGTLTYYFDPGQSLQKINLHALTGDPSQLTHLMTQFYGLRQEHSLGGQLYTSRWNNRVSSVLHVAPAPIIYAGADHSKYIVFLELNQTNANFSLSEEAGAFLKNVQATQRW